MSKNDPAEFGYAEYAESLKTSEPKPRRASIYTAGQNKFVTEASRDPTNSDKKPSSEPEPKEDGKLLPDGKEQSK